jgi:hypothetical protein
MRGATLADRRRRVAATRRQILKWGLGAGALAGTGLLAREFWPVAPSPVLRSPRELAIELFDAIDPAQRASSCVSYDHPLRQYHNRGVDTGGTWGFQLSRGARQLMVDLLHAGLSERGRQILPNQFFYKWSGVNATRLLFCGDPRSDECQVLITGAHLNLRLLGKSREGVAFGGPQVYGDQRGDGEVGLPGNVYRHQLALGQRLIEGLTPGERERVRCPLAPVQTAVEVQGAEGNFDGLPVAELSPASRALARDVLAAILDTYAEEHAAYAWECLDRNGGVDALHFADYEVDNQGGRRAGAAPSQIYRFEGPSAVFHYRGEPHLHALLNVAMDGERPLSVGDVVGENRTRLGRAQVKALLEEVLVAETGADLGYYPLESVAGTLRAGTIRTGDLYNLESWRDDVALAEIRGDAVVGEGRADLLARGERLEPSSVYRIAVPGWLIDSGEEAFGEVTRSTRGRTLREALIDNVRSNGFRSASA